MHITPTSREIDAGLDCVGTEDFIRMGFNLVATSGAFVFVDLIGTQINIPLFPFVAREFTYHRYQQKSRATARWRHHWAGSDYVR